MEGVINLKKVTGRSQETGEKLSWMIHPGESTVGRRNGTERDREVLSETTIESDSTETSGGLMMIGAVRDTMREGREMANIVLVKGTERTIVNVSRRREIILDDMVTEVIVIGTIAMITGEM